MFQVETFLVMILQIKRKCFCCAIPESRKLLAANRANNAVMLPHANPA